MANIKLSVHQVIKKRDFVVGSLALLIPFICVMVSQGYSLFHPTTEMVMYSAIGAVPFIVFWRLLITPRWMVWAYKNVNDRSLLKSKLDQEQNQNATFNRFFTKYAIWTKNLKYEYKALLNDNR